MSRPMPLTTYQRIIAEGLLRERPPVIPGTRVILNDQQREAWYAKVTATMHRMGLPDSKVHEFCNVAGVPE